MSYESLIKRFKFVVVRKNESENLDVSIGNTFRLTWNGSKEKIQRLKAEDYARGKSSPENTEIVPSPLYGTSLFCGLDMYPIILEVSQKKPF